MNRRLLVSLLTLTVFVSLLLILNHQNQIAADDRADSSYMSFNRGDTTKAREVMNFWRQEEKRIAAVKEIVVVDYVLILVYVLYLCSTLLHRRKIERLRLPAPRSWLLTWLRIAVGCILLGAVIDAFQDGMIYIDVSSHDPVGSLRWWTWTKWGLLIAGVLPLLIPEHFSIKGLSAKLIGWLSGLLNTIWTFFPSLLFMGLTMYCFWVRGQGKDILVAFTEVKIHPFDPTRIILFLTVGFWIYLTWYSSRVIAYIKEKHSPIPGEFLDNYPRLAGNAGFLILELAVLQSPILEAPLTNGEAFVLFSLGLLLLYWLDRWIRVKWKKAPAAASHFWIVYVIYFILLLFTSLLTLSRENYLVFLFGLLIGLHGIFLFYSNLHHVVMESRIKPGPPVVPPPPTFFNRIMNYFCIPLEEAGFFRWFVRLSVVAIIIDCAAVKWLGFARTMGPFPIVILGFSMLLALGNVVTAFSARYRINFHLFLFLIAFLFGRKEIHNVRPVDLGPTTNAYRDRTSLTNYLTHWLERLPKDTTRSFDMYFVLADGGASRSGYWTASVLGQLEDFSMQDSSGDRFSRHLFCLSGTSGGGVGVATFFSLLNDKQADAGASYTQSAANFLAQDYFSYTFARMLGPDYFFYILPFGDHRDRGAALEEAFERYHDTSASPRYQPSFGRPFSQFKALAPDSSIALPILFVNTTRMQDGNPGLVTNLLPEKAYFGQRVDVAGLLDTHADISMASAAILGARFPYLSPAGRIGNNYFVDGGYFDNSGAGAVQELIRGILNVSNGDAALEKQVARLKFKVLHIMNSPLAQDSLNLKAVLPIQNDLFSPVLTIVGAYDMQTTVNDIRLIHYLDDIKSDPHIPTDYQQISLYEDSTEWKKDPLRRRFKNEPEYSMNWFMSDSTRHRIDQRLKNHPVVNAIMQQFKKKP